MFSARLWLQKSLLRLFFNKEMWGKVMKAKYVKDGTSEAWTRMERKSVKGASHVWKLERFCQSIPLNWQMDCYEDRQRRQSQNK